MANANTVAFAVSLPGAAQGASSTSEFQFNNASAVPSYFTIPAGMLNRKRFRLVAGGRVKGGTTTNFTAKVYLGSAFGSGTLVFSTGAVAVNSTTGRWRIEVEGSVDETGNKISATGHGGVNATDVAQAVSTLTADPATALSFCATGQFSASNADNGATMDYLELEVL